MKMRMRESNEKTLYVRVWTQLYKYHNDWCITSDLCVFPFSKQLTKLRNLDLSNLSSLSPNSVGDVMSNIPHLDTLNLCLSKNINDSCVRCIAASCKKLKYLFLVSCNITDEGEFTAMNLRGGIRFFLDHCVTTMGRWPFWHSHLEVSYCTFRLGSICANYHCRMPTTW